METLTREYLQELFDTHGTYGEIINKLGLNPYSGGGYRTIKNYIIKYHINLDKFEVLKKQETSSRTKKLGKSCVKYTAENIFQKHDICIDNETLKKFILRDNLLSYRCNECNIGDVYNNKPITLQLDHKDGDRLNNELLNLRFLCPNCHTQTHTYGSRNRKNKKPRKLSRVEYWEIKNGEIIEKDRELVKKVLESNIDLSKYGWSGKVSKIINRPPQKVAIWMRKHMPLEYSNAWKKKKRT